MPLTLFVSFIARRLRALRNRREPRRYSDVPRRIRLASSTAMRLVFVGGRPVIRFVDTERKEQLRLATLSEVSFSVINGRPVLRFTGSMQKRKKPQPEPEPLLGNARLVASDSLKFYTVSGKSHIAIIN